MAKKLYTIKIVLIIVFMQTALCCTTDKPVAEDKKQTPMNVKLEWSAGVCAPELYPVEVYRGDFYTSADWEPIPNGGSVDAGWGDNGMNMGETNIIPEGFKITYFSYFENKFYTGKFELPHARIKQLFEEGVIDYRSKKFETYIAIIVGMAPEGVLVVWMMTYDKQIEIGRYQAKETDLDWKIFKPNVSPEKREEFIKVVTGRLPEALANFQKNGLSHGLWDTYRIKYSWRPQFEFPEGSSIGGIDLKMYNGETDFVWGDRLDKNDYEKRALTWRIEMLWKDETGKDWGTDIFFDENEIFDAYKQIYRNDKELDAELVFKFNHNRSSLIISLRSKAEEIELRKCKIDLFERK